MSEAKEERLRIEKGRTLVTEMFLKNPN